MPRKNQSSNGGSKGGSGKAPEFIKVESFEIRRAHEGKAKNGGTLNFADVTINGVTVYGCRAVTYKAQDGTEKDFLAWPEEKGADGNYYKKAYAPLSDADQQKICDAIYAKLDNPD